MVVVVVAEGKNGGPTVEAVEYDVAAAAATADTGPRDCGTLVGRPSRDTAGSGAMLEAGHKAVPGLEKSADI